MLSQITQTNGHRIQFMQVCQNVNERMSHDRTLVLWDPFECFFVVVEGTTINTSHHVEPGPRNVWTFAEPQGSWHGYGGRPEGRNECPLPAHIVRFWQQLSLWRSTNDGFLTIGIDYFIGQI